MPMNSPNISANATKKPRKKPDAVIPRYGSTGTSVVVVLAVTVVVLVIALL